MLSNVRDGGVEEERLQLHSVCVAVLVLGCKGGKQGLGDTRNVRMRTDIEKTIDYLHLVGLLRDSLG